MLGASLESVIGPGATAQVRALLLESSDRRFDVVVADAPRIAGRRFDATLHRSDDLLLLELEPEVPDAERTSQGIVATIRMTIATSSVSRATTAAGRGTIYTSCRSTAC